MSVRMAGVGRPASTPTDPLVTGRLRLRRLVQGDLAALVELDSDPEVMRYLSGGTPTPREYIEEVVLPRFLERFPGRPWLGVWAIEPRDDSVFLGWVSLHPARPDAPAEGCLGYRLRRVAWGRGYATEAACAVLDAAFLEGDTTRVEASTYERNLASQRVLEKLGMRLLRRHRMTTEELAAVTTFDATTGDVWDGDDLVFGIDREEWVAAATAAGAGSARTSAILRSVQRAPGVVRP